MPATGSTREPVALSVKLEVLTKDKLKKFVFGLTKSKDGAVDKWHMDFEMLDRADTSKDFARAFFLDIDIDLKKVAATDLDATAKNGLNKPQVDFSRTMVAGDADKFKEGTIGEDKMKRTARNVIPARNA